MRLIGGSLTSRDFFRHSAAYRAGRIDGKGKNREGGKQFRATFPFAGFAVALPIRPFCGPSSSARPMSCQRSNLGVFVVGLLSAEFAISKARTAETRLLAYFSSILARQPLLLPKGVVVRAQVGHAQPLDELRRRPHSKIDS